jgi:hypothetical protein
MREKPDSNPRTSFSMSIVPGVSTSLPKSFAPARAPSTMSRLIAEAKMMMKIEERKK